MLVVLFFSVTAYSETKTVIVVGDSLSAAHNLKLEQGWVQLMADRMEKSHPDWQVVNLAFSGATTNNGLRLLPNALEKLKPQLMLLELGANDGLQGKPIPLITKNLQILIDQATAANVQTILLGVRLPPNYGKRYTDPFFAQYERLASENKLLYVPFILENVAGNPQLMQGDGLHPTAEGQPIILENIWPTVKRAMEER